MANDMRSASKQFVVVRVRADPEPDPVLSRPDSKRPMSNADPGRPDLADLLEVQGRMLRIGLQSLKVTIGKFSNRFWKRVVTSPKLRCGVVVHSGRVRAPA